MKKLWLSLFGDGQSSGEYWLTPVQPIMQQGPSCGLVALAMAMEALRVECSVQSLLATAQRMGLTRQGEMMSGWFAPVDLLSHLLT